MTVQTNCGCKNKIDREQDREHDDHPGRDEFLLDAIGDDKGCDQANGTVLQMISIGHVLVARLQNDSLHSKEKRYNLLGLYQLT